MISRNSASKVGAGPADVESWYQNAVDAISSCSGSSSPDDRHPEGLGNSSGQLGRHYTTKMFAHVNGLFPGVNFNRHTGPAA